MAEGVKYDGGKPMPRLLPPSALLAISRVLTFGAKKYSPDNWKHVVGAKERYLDAMLRHILAYNSGEILDQESGENHLAHAGCCLLFLLDASETGLVFPEEKSSQPTEVTK
jgi:hypothetical protein